MALTAKKGSKKAFKVQPLRVEAPAPQPSADAKVEAGVNALEAELAAALDAQAFFAIVDRADVRKRRDWLKANRPELSERVEAAVKAAQERTKPAEPAPDA
jgi:hypothetical protein